MTKKFLSLELSSLLKRSPTVPSLSSSHPLTKALIAEQKTLSFSGLSHKDFQISDVPIKYQGLQTLHTIHCGHHNKETLVLIHGYSGASALFYPVLKDLSQRFRIYCVDLLGLGLSSRPDFPCKTTQESLDYYLDSLEEWRKTVGLERFSMGGHSFGGYVSAKYALKYPGSVDVLYLFSPIGLSESGEQNKQNEWANMSWSSRQFWHLYFQAYSKVFWKQEMTPSELVRQYPSLAKFFIRSYIQTLMKSELDKASVVSEYLFETLSIPGGSDKSIHQLLRPPRQGAVIPLERIIEKELRVPIYCYYGVQDWVDWSGANKLVQDPKNKHFRVEWIPNAGHQTLIQNPKEITKLVLGTPKSKV